MNRRTVLTGLAALMATGAYYATFGRTGAGADLLPMAAQAQEGDPAEVVDMALGDPDAPVEVIEYASFTCPHCRNFHAENFKKLKADYIDTGKVRFIYREVYFDRYGLWAGMVARCGGEMRYFGLVEMIYSKQGEWAKGAPAEIADNLRRLGRTAGLGNEELDACLSDQQMAEAMVADYQANAEKHGIEATPSFVINGTTYSNMSWGEFSSLLDEEIAKAS